MPLPIPKPQDLSQTPSYSPNKMTTLQLYFLPREVVVGKSGCAGDALVLLGLGFTFFTVPA
eukprot:2978601-Amphidinium_carterae.1